MDAPTAREIIAENLLARRKQLEMTQREVSEAMGYERCWYQKREYGEAPLDLDEVPRLCEVLDIDDPRMLLRRGAFSREQIRDLL